MLASDFDPQRGRSNPAGRDAARANSLEQCLRSPNLRPTHLLTEFTDRQLAARLTRLNRTAHEAETDHGVTTLFAAFGFLRWFEGNDLERGSCSRRCCSFRSSSTARRSNPSSRSRCRGGRHPSQPLPRGVASDRSSASSCRPRRSIRSTPKTPIACAAISRRSRERVKHVPRWGVVETAALGRVQLPEARDVGGPRPQRGTRRRRTPLCRAIAGDAAVSLAAAGRDCPPRPTSTGSSRPRPRFTSSTPTAASTRRSRR